MAGLGLSNQLGRGEVVQLPLTAMELSGRAGIWGSWPTTSLQEEKRGQNPRSELDRRERGELDLFLVVFNCGH